MSGKSDIVILYGYRPDGNQLVIDKTSVVQGPHYGRMVWTGATGIALDKDWSTFSILDLYVPIVDPLMSRFWHPVIRKLPIFGHMQRFCDSLLRIAMYPNSRQLGLDISFEHPDYWSRVVQALVVLHEKVLRANRETIRELKDSGQYDRFYMRVFASCTERGIGPVMPDPEHPTMGELTMICQPFGDYGHRGAVLVPATRPIIDVTGRVKTSANYLTYLTLKFEALQAAAKQGIHGDDVYTLKMGPQGEMLLGEAATSTIGAIFERNGQYRLIVPDPEAVGTLPGFTAAWAIRLARHLGIEADYGVISARRFEDEAVEAFISGNATRIKPVGAIKKRPLKSDIVSEIAELYLKVVKGELFPEYSHIVTL